MWVTDVVKIRNLADFLNEKKLRPGQWNIMWDRQSSTREVAVIYWREV